jgi:hypothetical protein
VKCFCQLAKKCRLYVWLFYSRLYVSRVPFIFPIFYLNLVQNDFFYQTGGSIQHKNKFLMVQLRPCDCYIWMHFVTLHWVSVTFGCCNSWLFYISSVDFSCPKVCPRLSKNSTYVMICLNMLHKYVFGVVVVIFH